jgi:single-stranded-DNA-specific exonuclease
MPVKKRWIAKPLPSPDIIHTLAGELNISTVLSTILAQRGIHDYDMAKKFFRPELSDIHDPFLMKGMSEAVERIQTAISKNENILIYGDYDVDGTTSVALTYLFFKSIYSNIGFYIPDRHTEGYGISKKGVDYAAANGYKLIIALDCGIKALDKVEQANRLGVDFIICDHHLPGDELPSAIAVLDPKRNDCPYPYKELSGCGIGFKLIQAYSIRNGLDPKLWQKYMQLVAVSIASDLVHITGENRVLAYWGIRQLRQDPLPGLLAILESYLQKEDYSVSDLVFGIGPRINAAGRLADAKHAVNVMICDHIDEARKLAKGLNETNDDRKLFDRSITLEALQMVADNDIEGRRSNVLYKEDWHKGVIGIVASRVIEKYYRPTIILTASNGVAVGSARSVAGFNLYEALEKCSEELIQFGGHQYAAGMTLDIEKVPSFQKKFEEVVAASINRRSLHPEVEYDAHLSFSDITPKFYRILTQMEPFGPENMKPVFMSTNLFDGGLTRVVGNNHLKLHVKQEDCTTVFDAIGFGMGEFFGQIKAGNRFAMCYTIEENTFRDTTSMQLNVKDIRIFKDHEEEWLNDDLS